MSVGNTYIMYGSILILILAKVEEEMRKSPLAMFDPLTKTTNLQDNNLLHNG